MPKNEQNQTEGQGTLEKLIFTAYPKNDFKDGKKKEGAVGKTYQVTINPSSIKRSMEIIYNDKKASGQASTSQDYKFTVPETWSLDFIIDGTGIATGKIITNNDEFVQKEIEEFLSVVYAYNGDIHRHPFVEVNYAGHIFQGVITSLDINYDLFYPNGRPLRAKVSCAFKSAANFKKAKKKAGENSPDMTHRRMINEDETLVSKTFDIYESNDYYISVARANDLNNFRKIKAGTELYFPPLKNQS
jgi:hypothetical protein